MLRKITAIWLGFIFLAMLVPCAASADSMLSWDASEGEVTGYRIYYGTNQGGDYPGNIEAGGATQYSLLSLPLTEGETYYFVVRTRTDPSENNSNNTEISTVVQSPSPNYYIHMR